MLLLCLAAKKGPWHQKKYRRAEKRRKKTKKEEKTKEDEKMMVFLGTRSKMRKHFVRLERSLAN